MAAIGDRDLSPGVVTGVSVVAGPRVGSALAHMARRRGLALRQHVEAGARTAAACAELAADTGTRVVALCLDGIADGVALCAALGRLREAGRHVVLLQGDPACGGRAPGLRTASLHRALLEAEGAIIVESHRELMDVALFVDSLGRSGLPTGRRVAILTGGGGGGVIAADLCGRHGLEVPPLAAATREALVPLVPAIASTANPVDLTPEMFNEKFYDRFPQVLDVVAADPGVDALFLPTTFNAPRGDAVAAQVLAEFHARSPKPVLIGAGGTPEMQPVFAAGGVAPIADTALAALALAKLAARAQLPTAASRTGADAAFAWPEASEAALPGLLARTGFAQGHEEAGALALQLVGLRDAAFGPVIALGAGGLAARVLDDLVFAPAPCDAGSAAGLLARSRAVGHARRMDAALDLDVLAAAVARFSQVVAAAPWRDFVLALDPIAPGSKTQRVAEARLVIAGREG